MKVKTSCAWQPTCLEISKIKTLLIEKRQYVLITKVKTHMQLYYYNIILKSIYQILKFKKTKLKTRPRETSVEIFRSMVQREV